MKMSAFRLVTLFMVTNEASMVNQINSHKTISPEGSVCGRISKSEHSPRAELSG